MADSGRGKLLSGGHLGGPLRRIPGQELDHGLTDAVEFGAELAQYLGGDAFFTDESQQDVLGPDVVVAELEGLTERQFEDLLGAR